MKRWMRKPGGWISVPSKETATRGSRRTEYYPVSTDSGTANKYAERDPPQTREDFPARAWLKDDPALKEIVAEEAMPQPNWVYRVGGALDPGRCGTGDQIADA